MRTRRQHRNQGVAPQTRSDLKSHTVTFDMVQTWYEICFSMVLTVKVSSIDKYQNKRGNIQLLLYTVFRRIHNYHVLDAAKDNLQYKIINIFNHIVDKKINSSSWINRMYESNADKTVQEVHLAPSINNSRGAEK